MRKTLVIIGLAALGALVAAGCEDENLVPYFTRWDASIDCGVAPLTVQFVARASGGDPTESLSGANSRLDIDWDFRDGATASGSLVYHTFADPGVYEVAVTVRDKDGDGETQQIPIEVQADSLTVRALPGATGATPDTTVARGQIVPFTVFARACGFLPDASNAEYNSRFLFTWRMNNQAGTVYSGRSPRHTFALADTGLRHIVVTVLDDQRSVTRNDTVTVRVTP